MTSEAQLKDVIETIQKARVKLDGCGAEAIGTLRALDEAGFIPESVRDQVLDILTRWRSASDEAKAAAGLPC